MRRFKSVLLFLSIILVLSLNAETPVQTGPPDDFCGIRNTSFKNGEQLNYIVYYSIIGLYVNAGNATLSINLERMNNRPVYHITGSGKSNSSYNWISKVNNRYETFIDTGALQPVKFIRDVHEGKHKKYENITFNRTARTAITNNGVYKVPDCVQDVVSCLYYARNINFNKYKPGDKISFSMFLDNEVYNMYIRYIGKEDVKTKYGKFRAIKFKPLLIKGTVFEGGEKMSVWVTDDANRVPLRVESSLAVGSIKVDMMGYKNLRYPMTSLKSMR
ncbi:MAG: DUF3108 domain-containing protein [Bacteroidota bacterium]|nr:DUF3108 domain-containing protein [Bacteroidota bacterium]